MTTMVILLKDDLQFEIYASEIYACKITSTLANVLMTEFNLGKT